MTDTKYTDIIMHQAATPTKIKPVDKVIHNKTEKSSLFMVEQFNNTYIYKISDPKTSFRNLMLAQALLKNGVPVPDSKVFVGNNQYFETYKMTQGSPLSVAFQELDIPSYTMELILYNVLECDKKISETVINNKNILEQLVLHTRRTKHNIDEFGKGLATIYGTINKRLTTYGNITLHHADLNPSNILLHPNLRFKSLLDLDSIALCDEYTMLAQILLSWPNVSIKTIVEIYNSVFNKDINAHHLKHLVRFKKMKTVVATKLRNRHQGK